MIRAISVALALLGNIRRKVPAERKGAAAQSGIFAGRLQQRKWCSGLEIFPGHLPGNALQHGEHGIVFRKNPAN